MGAAAGPVPAWTLSALRRRFATGRGTGAAGLHGMPAPGHHDHATVARGDRSHGYAWRSGATLRARATARDEVTRSTARQGASGSGRGRGGRPVGPPPVRD